MLSIVTKGLKEVQRQLEKDKKQMRFAAWKAAGETSKIVHNDVSRTLSKVFDRPTPFIKKSLRPTFPSKASRKPGGPNIVFGVGFKDVFGKSGEDVAQVLLPHIEGGPRRPKASEARLRRAGILKGNEFLVPSRTAPLDRYGNITKGVMSKILSDLRTFNEAGFTANVNLNKRNAQYIFGRVGNTRGIFKVQGGFGLRGKAATGRWSLIFLVVKGAPRYRKRFDFYGIATKSFSKNYEREFNKAFEQALRTAK